MLFEMLDELISLHALKMIYRSDIVNRYLRTLQVSTVFLKVSYFGL